MNKIYTLLSVLLLTASTFAQSPEKMSYQAIVRDGSDALITNQTVGMQISILQTTAGGSAVYVETQTPTSNINGLVTLEIGNGTATDDFSTINWSAGPFFIKTETDPTGGTNYTITGTSQLLSVPYALYAKTAENVFTGEYNDLSNTPFNFNTISSTGIESTVFNSVASGQNSIAMGAATEAGGYASTAMGDSSIASGSASTAMGLVTIASGTASTAMGSSTKAIDHSSTAMGNTTTASGYASTAMGATTIASGTASTTMGTSTKAIGHSSTAMGNTTTANGDNSTTMGILTEANSTASTAMGDSSIANGSASTAMGLVTIASGTASTTMGTSTISSGYASTAMGNTTTANGDNSTTMGIATTAEDFGTLAIGILNTPDLSPNPNTFDLTNRAFVIGNGVDNANKSDALTVLFDGTTTINGAVTATSFSGDGSGLTNLPSELPTANNIGDMNYWNGSSWEVIPATTNEGATLQMISGVPTWTGGTPLQIGDLRAGGVVFYIAPTPTDLDGDGDLDNGLVCAFNDHGTSVVWGCEGTDLPNVPNIISGPLGLGAEIGDGFNNTNKILNDCPTAGAALATRSLGPNWFLPSIKELNEIYVNRVTLEAVSGFTAFSNLEYYSSTEYDFLLSWHQYLVSGQQSSDLKGRTLKVRAVRTF